MKPLFISDCPPSANYRRALGGMKFFNVNGQGTFHTHPTNRPQRRILPRARCIDGGDDAGLARTLFGPAVISRHPGNKRALDTIPDPKASGVQLICVSTVSIVCALKPLF